MLILPKPDVPTVFLALWVLALCQLISSVADTETPASEHVKRFPETTNLYNINEITHQINQRGPRDPKY